MSNYTLGELQRFNCGRMRRTSFTSSGTFTGAPFTTECFVAIVGASGGGGGGVGVGGSGGEGGPASAIFVIGTFPLTSAYAIVIGSAGNGGGANHNGGTGGVGNAGGTTSLKGPSFVSDSDNINSNNTGILGLVGGVFGGNGGAGGTSNENVPGTAGNAGKIDRYLIDLGGSDNSYQQVASGLMAGGDPGLSLGGAYRPSPGAGGAGHNSNPNGSTDGAAGGAGYISFWY